MTQDVKASTDCRLSWRSHEEKTETLAVARRLCFLLYEFTKKSDLGETAVVRSGRGVVPHRETLTDYSHRLLVIFPCRF